MTRDLVVYRIDNVIKRGCLRFGANVPVSASGVIARSLSNELKDAFNDGCISDKSVLDRVVC